MEIKKKQLQLRKTSKDNITFGYKRKYQKSPFQNIEKNIETKDYSSFLKKQVPIKLPTSTTPTPKITVKQP